MLVGSKTSLVRDLALVGSLFAAASACGDDEPADSQQASRCGDPGSWPLLSAPDAVGGGVLGVVEGRVVAHSTQDGTTMLHGTGTCGDSPVSAEVTGAPQVVGTTVLAVGPEQALRFDPVSGATHRAFGPVFTEIHDTPAGLLALGIGGKLLLHPDPADAALEPTVLLEGAAWLPRTITADTPGWPHLWTDGTQTFALSTDFELVRVALGGGEPQVELTEVQEFHVVDEGRKVLWRGLTGEMLTLTDLGTGEELWSIEQRDGNWSANQVGSWILVTTDRGRLVNVDSGLVIEPVEFDAIEIVPTNVDVALLVGYPNGSIDRGYWTIAPEGTLRVMLAPDGCLEFDSQIEPTGIVTPDAPCDPLTSLYNPLDDMVLNPFDGGAPEPLGTRFGFAYQILEAGFVLSWTEVPGAGKGELSADSPSTEPVVLADEVTIAPPVVEGLDAYYFELGRGVQRFTIDPG